MDGARQAGTWCRSKDLQAKSIETDVARQDEVLSNAPGSSSSGTMRSKLVAIFFADFRAAGWSLEVPELRGRTCEPLPRAVEDRADSSDQTPIPFEGRQAGPSAQTGLGHSHPSRTNPIVPTTRASRLASLATTSALKKFCSLIARLFPSIAETPRLRGRFPGAISRQHPTQSAPESRKLAG